MAVTKFNTSFPSASVDQNLYARWISLTTGKIWNGSAMVTIVGANVATYGVAAVYLGLDEYQHTTPAALPADSYRAQIYVREGSTQAESDVKTNDVFNFTWDGTTLTQWLTAASGGASGAGSNSIPVQIYNTDTTAGVPYPAIWITTDSAGSVLVAGTVSGDSTGNYTFLLTTGNTYYAWATGAGINAVQGVSFVANTTANRINTTTATAGTSWYYAAQSDAEDAISSTGLQIASNMENTSSSTNSARVLRAGLFADALMDGRLKAMGFTTPLSLSNANDAAILKQISVYIVLVQLGRWRALQVVNAMGDGSRTVLAKLGEEWWKAANDLLGSIDNGNILLTATRSMTIPLSNADALDIAGFPMYPHAWYGWLTI